MSIQHKYKLENKDLIIKTRATFKEVCFPEKYTVQKPQKFVGRIMAPTGDVMSLLIYHKIGAGKTCASIQIGTKWRKNAMFVMPASLIPGFKNELRTPCSPVQYITADESNELTKYSPSSTQYKALIRASDARIAADYTILSYNKFAAGEHRAPGIIVVDEVQNVISTASSAKYYNALLSFIVANPNMRVVLMSATPIFDSPRQLPLLLKLLRIELGELSPDNLRAVLGANSPAAAISYYSGAPAHTFPAVIRKLIRCEFSNYQARFYVDMVAREMRLANSSEDFFYTKSRQRSNIVYPNELSPTEGYAAITQAQITTHLATYSAKFAKWITRAKKPGHHFTFCEYTGASGIKIMAKILRAAGWHNYFKAGPGRYRYVIWSGNETPAQKNEIRAVYNSRENDNYDHIKMIIGSSSMKEGVSLLRVKYAHIMLPYWNQSYMSQVEGRCVRFCSAKNLPREERKVVINYYIGVTPGFTTDPDPKLSVDWYIYTRAGDKQREVDQYLKVLKEEAIDRDLFQIIKN